jgi:hypothetical protein
VDLSSNWNIAWEIGQNATTTAVRAKGKESGTVFSPGIVDDPRPIARLDNKLAIALLVRYKKLALDYRTRQTATL